MFAILTFYWVNVLAFGGGGLIQLLLGTALVLVAPGLVLTELVGIKSGRLGFRIAAIVSVSSVVVALSAISTAAVLTVAGVERTLSFRPLAATLTGILLVLLALLYVLGANASWSGFEPSARGRGELALLCIPLFGVAAAAAMRLSGSNIGSFVFVAVLAVSVVAIRHGAADGRELPLGVFVISLALLLHTNLTTPHIIGADIQGLYAISNHAFLTESWLPALEGFGESIPMMTAVPAAIAILTGAPFGATFKLLFVLLFSFVPVLLYYFTESLFDPEIAYFGALFFAFYHLSFAFTPGKQLIAELFAVLVLFTLGIDREHDVQPVLLAIFSAGMVFSHYGVTYVLAFSLLAGWAILVVAKRAGVGLRNRLSPMYPVVLITAATGWYALTSIPLVSRIFSVPTGIVSQFLVLLSGRTVERSGITYVGTGTTTLESLNILLYGALIAFIAIGLAGLSLSLLRNRRSASNRVPPEYVALTLPIFLLLGSSFLFVLDLWADRVFQLALVVLAPLVPLGYRYLSRAASRITPTGRSVMRVTPVTVLLVVLLLFSSGFIFAASGQASTSTFDQNANDLSFDEADLQAVEWLRANTEISRTESAPAVEDDPLYVDSPERVQVYTDTRSYQLLRSTLSPRYYSTELVQLKNQWRPSISPASVEEGYVLLREEAIIEDPEDGPAPATVLTESEVATLRDRGTVVYDRNGVQIVRVTEDGEG